MTESGVYYPDGSFKGSAQIRVEALRAGEPIYHTRMPGETDFEFWQDEMMRRRDARIEYEGRPECVEIEIPTEKPVVIGQMGDNHIGGMYHAYELMGRHANVIKEHPLFYVGFGGDLFEGFFFNPAQDKSLGSFYEERAHARAMIDHIGNDKILWACEGDHDMWEGKMGGNFYEDFQRKYEAYLLRGVSKIKLRLSSVDGNVDYSWVTAHRLPGFSMHNRLHPTFRASRFGVAGADIYGCYHTHKKALGYQSYKTFDGTIHQLHFVPGPYKYDDDLAQKMGYGRLDEEDLGAIWIVLWPKQKRMEGFKDIEGAIDRVAPYLD